MLKNLELKRYMSRLMGGEYALEASTIPPYPTIDPRTATTAAKASAYTVTMADLEAPTIFSNTGAGGAVAFTLPSAREAKGKVVRVYALAAQVTRLTPQATDAVNYNGNAVVNKYAELAGVIGNYFQAVSDGKQWVVTEANGVVTKQS